MSERKVLNKYYPPDFDPSKIPRRRLGRDRQQVVRLMAPFSMRCNTCGEYVYKGKKFNARKETVNGETYYGIKIFRFYIKCPRCSAEITFKTDPKNTDYLAEHGASRNFEPWRDSDGAGMTDQEKLDLLEAQEAAQAAERPGAVASTSTAANAEVDASDPMAALESRTADSKREMEILDKLQEIRMRNARMERAGKGLGLDGRVVAGSSSGAVAVDELLHPAEAEEAERKRIEEEEIEEEVRRVFFARGGGTIASIELDEDLEPGEEVLDEEDDSAPPLPSDPAPPPPPDPGPVTSTSVKRKLADVEPDVVSLLPEETRKIVGTFVASSGSNKKSKKGDDLAKKLGIKVVKR